MCPLCAKGSRFLKETKTTVESLLTHNVFKCFPCKGAHSRCAMCRRAWGSEPCALCRSGLLYARGLRGHRVVLTLTQLQGIFMIEMYYLI